MKEESGVTSASPPALEAGCGEKPEPVTLGDALAEIAYLRQALSGSIIGDRIIAEQFARADTPILQWAHRQATANMEHAQTCLDESRADFPFEGRKDLAKAEGRDQ